MCGWETVVLLEKPAASEEAADKGARSETDEEPKEIGAMNAAIAAPRFMAHCHTCPSAQRTMPSIARVMRTQLIAAMATARHEYGAIRGSSGLPRRIGGEKSGSGAGLF